MTDDQARPVCPLPELMPALLDDEGRVAVDLACSTCQYNLRTLACDSRCPECGESVRQSVQMTAETPAAWLMDAEAGAIGLMMAAWGLVVDIVIIAVSIAGDVQGAVAGSLAFVAVVAGVAVLAGGLGGIMGFTVRDSNVREGFTARRLSRWCLMALVLDTLMIISDIMLVYVQSDTVAATLGLSWTVLATVMWCALLAHAGKVMRRMSRADVASFAGRLSCVVGFGSCVAVGCLAFLAFGPPFPIVPELLGLFSLVILGGLFMASATLFWRVLRVLKAARHQIEQYTRESVASLPDTTNSAASESFDD